MTEIAQNITELVGGTPLVKLNNLSPPGVNVLLKLESFNPCSSVKDRIAKSMVLAAEEAGILKKGVTVVEPTSGNTGIGLAFVCASRGYKLILTMPDTMSIERRKLLRALGAQIVLTPGAGGMAAAIARAEEIVKQEKNAIMPGQFSNPANPAIHRLTTAEEIWKDTGGTVDYFIAGVGTGGTVSGTGAVLKQHNPDIKVIAVEPAGSPVISGGQPGPHKIQGIGAGFIPDNFDRSVIDEVVTVQSGDAGQTARDLAAKEGILGGISSGANVYAALEIANRSEAQGKTIVTVLCDTGERYLSTGLFDGQQV
jgi:cysteine synthase A